MRWSGVKVPVGGSRRAVSAALENTGYGDAQGREDSWEDDNSGDRDVPAESVDPGDGDVEPGSPRRGSFPCSGRTRLPSGWLCTKNGFLNKSCTKNPRASAGRAAGGRTPPSRQPAVTAPASSRGTPVGWCSSHHDPGRKRAWLRGMPRTEVTFLIRPAVAGKVKSSKAWDRNRNVRVR